MSSSINFGTSDRAAHSAERSRTCCSLGTSPVRRSQNRPAIDQTNYTSSTYTGMFRPSGSGSSPPGALGSNFWHSGIYGEVLAHARTRTTLRLTVFPLNRIPSSASRTDPYLELVYTRSKAIHNANLPHKRLDTPSTPIDLVKRDFTNHLGAVFSADKHWSATSKPNSCPGNAILP